MLAETCHSPIKRWPATYELHVVKSGRPRLATTTAAAANAPPRAPPALVIVAGGISRRRIAEAEEHYQSDAGLPQRSQDYHRHELARVR